MQLRNTIFLKNFNLFLKVKWIWKMGGFNGFKQFCNFSRRKLKQKKKRFSRSYIHFAFPEKSGSFEVEQIIFFLSFSCEKSAFFYYTFPVKCIIFNRLQFFKLPKFFHLYLCEFVDIGFEHCSNFHVVFYKLIFKQNFLKQGFELCTLIYKTCMYNMLMRLQLLILFNYLVIQSKQICLFQIYSKILEKGIYSSIPKIQSIF